MSVGVITIDGTKIKANASMDQNRSYRELVTQILREAEETDRREDELYGEQRGDELPEQLRTPEGRRQALADAKRRIEERKGRAVSDGGAGRGDGGGSRVGGAWSRCCGAVAGVSGCGSRAASWRRTASAQARPIPRDREDRLFEALGRLGGEPAGRAGRQRGL